MAITVNVQHITGATVRMFDGSEHHDPFSTVEISADEFSNVTLFFNDPNHAERAAKIAEAINGK